MSQAQAGSHRGQWLCPPDPGVASSLPAALPPPRAAWPSVRVIGELPSLKYLPSPLKVLLTDFFIFFFLYLFKEPCNFFLSFSPSFLFLSCPLCPPELFEIGSLPADTKLILCVSLLLIPLWQQMLKFCILLSARLPLPVITGPLLAVQSGLPGCLAFEPLCLNTCARAGAGAMHARAHMRERGRGLRQGPSRSPDGAEAGEASVGFLSPPLWCYMWDLTCLLDSGPPHQRAGQGQLLSAEKPGDSLPLPEFMSAKQCAPRGGRGPKGLAGREGLPGANRAPVPVP